MRKIFSLIAAVLFAGSMMAADATMTAGTNGSAADVNGNAAIKVGTSKAGGDMTITVGAGATTLSFYAAAWNNVNGLSLNITAPDGVTVTPASVDLTMDPGISNNSPFTLQGTEADFKFDLVLTGVEAETTLTLAGATAKRFVVWGATYTAGEAPVEPTMDYYVAGSMTNWGPMAAYKLAANPAVEGEYMGEFTFAANDEFKVGYSDGTTIESTNYFPTGMDNNYVITEAGDYTVYFRPDGQGGEGWHYGCINAIKKEAPAAITCADVYNMAKNDVVGLLNDVVVTYVNGANVYVKDATASMLIYLPKNTTVDWVAGNVLSGVAGVVDVYNGLYEVKPSADQIAAVTATAGEAPAAEELTAITAADVNKYASISNVTVAAGEFVTTSATNLDMVLNGTTYVLRNNFKIAYTFEAGREYNMVGVVSIYTKNDATTLQFFPITIEKIIGAAIENTNVEAETVKFFENGQLFINKNGVIYNAQGTIVR